MSIYNFPKDQFVRIFDANEVVKIAVHTLTGGEIGSVRMKIYNHGINTGAKIKLWIYPVGVTSMPSSESNEILITDIYENFYGFVRFDFNRENIPAGQYDIYAEIKNYARDSDTSFFSLVYDYPVQTYAMPSITHFNQTAICLEDFYYI